jgi:hypothetical protein
MKKESIKFHLAPYSIYQKRKTTINHAFASGIAPVDQYDEAKLRTALRSLGQDPDADLDCIYCGSTAETWDHLVGLVKNSELRGYGHQLGNLVPWCRDCNSKKGAKDWNVFLRAAFPDQFEPRSTLISSYLDQHAVPVDLQRLEKISPNDWTEYCATKKQILDLMKKADEIALRLRSVVASTQGKKSAKAGITVL